jgi:hypothetical protein
MSSPFFKRLKLRDLSWRDLATLVLAGYSTAATWWGLHALATLGSASLGPWLLVLSGLFTLAIEIILVGSARQLKGEDTMRGRTVMLVPLIGCLCLSTGFGFGAWHRLLWTDAIAEDNAYVQTSDITSYFAGVAGTSAKLRDYSAQLAAHSERMMNIEEEKGGTCGTPSGDGFGDRARLRQSDNRLAAAYPDYFDGRHRDAEAALTAARKIDGTWGERDAALRDALTTARAVAGDALLERYKAELGERISHTTFVGASGNTFTCHDPQLEVLAGAIIDLEYPSPPTEVASFDPSDARAALEHAFSRLGQRIGLVPRRSVDDPVVATRNRQRDALALGLAMGVDFLLIWVARPARRRSPTHRMPNLGGPDPGAPLLQRLVALMRFTESPPKRIDQLDRALREREFRVFGRPHVQVYQRPATEDELVLTRIMEIACEAGDASEYAYSRPVHWSLTDVLDVDRSVRTFRLRARLRTALLYASYLASTDMAEDDQEAA